MLNKKTLFNLIYAMALLGAVSACFGLLNEYLQVAQLYDVQILNLATLRGRDFWTSIGFYFVSMCIGAFTVIAVIRHLMKRKTPLKTTKINVGLVVAICLLLVLSVGIQYTFLDERDPSLYSEYRRAPYILGYYGYLVVSTLRSASMQLIMNFAIILGCNILEKKHQKKVQSCEECDVPRA